MSENDSLRAPTTRIYCVFKSLFNRHPSIQMAYLAAILEEQGHEVCWTHGELADGDVALVLSSLVDYRRETAWGQGIAQPRYPFGQK